MIIENVWVGGDWYTVTMTGYYHQQSQTCSSKTDCASDSKQGPIDSGGFVLYKLVLELCPKTVPGSSYKTRGKVWPIVGSLRYTCIYSTIVILYKVSMYCISSIKIHTVYIRHPLPKLTIQIAKLIFGICQHVYICCSTSTGHRMYTQQEC